MCVCAFTGKIKASFWFLSKFNIELIDSKGSKLIEKAKEKRIRSKKKGKEEKNQKQMLNSH